VGDVIFFVFFDYESVGLNTPLFIEENLYLIPSGDMGRE
jgi:hypothetical protein